MHGENGEGSLENVSRGNHGGASTTERPQCVGAASAARADGAWIGATGEARYKETERNRARQVGAESGGEEQWYVHCGGD